MSKLTEEGRRKVVMLGRLAALDERSYPLTYRAIALLFLAWRKEVGLPFDEAYQLAVRGDERWRETLREASGPP